MVFREKLRQAGQDEWTTTVDVIRESTSSPVVREDLACPLVGMETRRLGGGIRKCSSMYRGRVQQRTSGTLRGLDGEWGTGS